MHSFKALCDVGTILHPSQPLQQKTADVSITFRPAVLHSAAHWPPSMAALPQVIPTALAIDVTTTPGVTKNQVQPSGVAKNQVQPDPKQDSFEVHLVS